MEDQEKKRIEEEERERQRTFAKKSGQTEGEKKAKGYFNPGKEKSKLERKLKKIEENLEEKEAQLENWKQELQKPENQSDYVKLGEIQEQIDTLEMEVLAEMEEWEQVSSMLD